MFVHFNEKLLVVKLLSYKELIASLKTESSDFKEM